MPRAALAFLVALLLAAPAGAQQDPDLRALIERVNGLQRQVQDLQRLMVQSGVPAAAVGQPAQPSEEELARAARFELRLGAFEEELRRLTGSVEELAHRVEGLSQRLDRLVADVDFRLAALEKRGAQQGAPAPAGQAPAAAAAPAIVEMPPPAPQPGVLGTIPQSDLAQPPAQPPPTPTAALPPGTPEEQYKYAYDLLRQAEYEEAARALEAFIASYPQHPLSGNAYYWLAETFYVRGDFAQAAVYFARGFETFPDGSKAPDNLLKLGLSLAKLGRKDDACVTFRELADRFPNAEQTIRRRASEESRRLDCG